jgi:spermidine dehydrogenase
MRFKNDSTSADRALGLHASITRRDFLGSTLLASGGALLGGLTPAQLLAESDDWAGYGAVGEYRHSSGNPREVMLAGHRMRDKAYPNLDVDALDTGELYDCVIVGAGISGLAAALFFQQKTASHTRCLLLDNHPIFGGEAKQNEFQVDGQRLTAHQGSAIYLVPYPYSFIANFYHAIGLHAPKLSYQTWSASDLEMTLGRTPYDSAGLSIGQYGFWFGAKFGQKPGVWLIDPVGKQMQGAPLAAKTRDELYGWFPGQAAAKSKFVRPKFEGDEISRRLDSITLEQHYMEQFGLSRETVRTFLSPVEGGGSGLGPYALSAYNDYAADMLHPYEAGGEAVQMFPGGNTTIARLMVKALLPAAVDGPATVEGVTQGTLNFSALDVSESPIRLRLSSTVVSVRHDGDPQKSDTVSIVYAKEGKLFRVRARSAVMAGGSWTTKHIVRDLPEEHRAAYAVLPVAVNDGKCGRSQLALSLQNGNHRLSLVQRRGQLHGCAQNGQVRNGQRSDWARLARSALRKGVVLLPRRVYRSARYSWARRIAGHFVSGIRRALATTIHGYVFWFWIRCAKGYRGNYFESLGPCIP